MSNPSIHMKPSAYKAEKLYSVLPLNGDADFTVDRASVANRVNAQGLIEEVAIDEPRLNYLDSYNYKNKITFSEDLTATGWFVSSVTREISLIPSPIGTDGVWKIVSTNTASFPHERYDMSTSGDLTYSVYVKKLYDNDTIWLYVGGTGIGGGANTSMNYKFTFSTETLSLHSGGTADNTSVESLSNNWYRLSISFESTTVTTVRIYPTHGITSLSGVYAFGFQLESGLTLTSYQKRATTVENYEEISTCPHLLLEPTATNLVLRSNELDNASWVKGRATVTANQIESPDGTNNADKIISDSTASNTHYTIQNVTLADSETYTFSFFVKSAELNKVGITGRSKANSYNTSIFDLSTETFTTSGGTSRGFKYYGNGWYRIWQVFESETGVTPTQVQIYLDDGTGIVYDGDSTSGLYIYGAQLELGNVPSSFIPTTSASVTRLADTCDSSGNVTLFNSEEGVLFFELAALADDLTGRRITISDGTVDNRIYFRWYTTSNRFQIIHVVNSVAEASFSLTIEDITAWTKIAFKWKVNDFALWVNGVEELTDSSGAVCPANTYDRLHFSGYSKTADFYGKCRDIRVYNEALTDTELAALTAL